MERCSTGWDSWLAHKLRNYRRVTTSSDMATMIWMGSKSMTARKAESLSIPRKLDCLRIFYALVSVYWSHGKIVQVLSTTNDQLRNQGGHLGIHMISSTSKAETGAIFQLLSAISGTRLQRQILGGTHKLKFTPCTRLLRLESMTRESRLKSKGTVDSLRHWELKLHHSQPGYYTISSMPQDKAGGSNIPSKSSYNCNSSRGSFYCRAKWLCEFWKVLVSLACFFLGSQVRLTSFPA